MARQRGFLAALAALAVLTLAPSLYADTKVIVSQGSPHRITGIRVGLGTWIGNRPGPVVHGGPAHHPVVVAGSWRHRFIRLGPPVRPVVVRPPLVEVACPPVERPVVIQHTPTVTVRVPEPVAEGSVTVWITNSNGSRTSVSLRRDGPWYIGPRGEYYTEMPTNEQLRTVYGF